MLLRPPRVLKVIPEGVETGEWRQEHFFKNKQTKMAKPQTCPKNLLPVLLTPVIHGVYAWNVSGIEASPTWVSSQTRVCSSPR